MNILRNRCKFFPHSSFLFFLLVPLPMSMSMSSVYVSSVGWDGIGGESSCKSSRVGRCIPHSHTTLSKNKKRDQGQTQDSFTDYFVICKLSSIHRNQRNTKCETHLQDYMPQQLIYDLYNR